MTPGEARRPSRLKLLEVVGLTLRSRGRARLDAVSFTLEEGEILGLVGPPGAGKTTCLDCLSGLLAPDSGRVILDGREVTGRSPRRLARAGLVRAGPTGRPIRRLSAAGNVMVALARRHVPMPAALLGALGGPRVRRRAIEVLERVGLGDLAGQRAGLLAPGLLRRLEIAQGMALAPRLLLLDGLLDGLRPGEAAGVSALVQTLRAGGLGVLLAARPEPRGLVAVDRVVRLERGRVVPTRPPAPVEPV